MVKNINKNWHTMFYLNTIEGNHIRIKTHLPRLSGGGKGVYVFFSFSLNLLLFDIFPE